MMQRILVIKLAALGDFVQAFGPFAAIRAHHPGAEVTLLTTPPYAGLARLSPGSTGSGPMAGRPGRTLRRSGGWPAGCAAPASPGSTTCRPPPAPPAIAGCWGAAWNGPASAAAPATRTPIRGAT
ncbi:glycosyltransferase family 9 protein [Dankookia sp. P2]|uniref:glycosyltransferase family 9 protein n=1 Tax=Dankookia sp. P2 TaxID=3423955 RepID=UPI003D67FD67